MPFTLILPRLVVRRSTGLVTVPVRGTGDGTFSSRWRTWPESELLERLVDLDIALEDFGHRKISGGKALSRPGPRLGRVRSDNQDECNERCESHPLLLLTPGVHFKGGATPLGQPPNPVWCGGSGSRTYNPVRGYGSVDRWACQCPTPPCLPGSTFPRLRHYRKKTMRTTKKEDKILDLTIPSALGIFILCE